MYCNAALLSHHCLNKVYDDDDDDDDVGLPLFHRLGL